MKIAVLSGKGGTGKTTFSASFAYSINGCQYIDCDVEEPNGSIFLKPHISESIPVKVSVPVVDEGKCTGCGKCAHACQFNAIAVVKGNVLLFSELCHHCGACVIACPEKAIFEEDRTIGVIEKNADGSFMQGRLNISEPVSIPIISELKKRINTDKTSVIDCSPGASCTVVESIDGCDYCILVTEPTPFGLHDLKIAVELVRLMKIPYGVVINKSSKEKNNNIKEYCSKENINVLMEIPFSQEIARAYSKGILPVQDNPGLTEEFINLFKRLERGVCR